MAANRMPSADMVSSASLITDPSAAGCAHLTNVKENETIDAHY
jgi:hypothetical protein